MPRAKRGFKARRRHNRILKLAKGYRGSHSKLFRSAIEAVHRGLCYAYRDRKQRKRAFRRLWIIRINAACRQEGINYSRFMNGLKNLSIEMNRKSLSELAVNEPEAFKSLVEKVKAAQG